MPGSGKTEAAMHLKRLGLPVVSFSEIVKKTIQQRKLGDTLEVHHNVRQELRDKYGYQAMALLSHKKILEELKKHKLVVLEGMRSWEEYEYLIKEFPKANIFILALHVDKQKRYSRIKKRKERSQLGGEERDLDELIQTHMGPTIAYADYLIKNNYSLEELYHKLDEVYREIYYL
jgi:dephospho-CoA kinase